MRVGERLDQRVLDKVVGIGLFAVPAAYATAQERDLVFYLPQVFRRRLAMRPAIRLRWVGPGSGRLWIGIGGFWVLAPAPSR